MYETFSVLPAKDASCKRAAVVFSSLNANGFSFYNLFEQFSDNIHRIYLRDPFDQWYDQGISDEVPDWDAVIAKTMEALKELDVKHFMTFGASMGGYAALRFAAQCDADLCIALSPQTLLDRRLPHTPKKEVDIRNRDIKPYLDCWRSKNAAIFFGAADFVDIFNVFRINWQGADLFPIAGQDHLVAQYLLSKRVMSAMVADFVNKGAYSPITRMQGKKVKLDRVCFDEVQRLLINRIVEGFYMDAPWDVLASTRSLKALHAWADGYHIEARMLARKKDYPAAIRAANKAYSLAENSVTISDALAEIHYQAGNLDDAIEGYRRSLGIRSKHYGALCRLGTLLHSKGDVDGALDMLAQAVEIRPRLTRAQSIAKNLNLELPKP
jgi:tetratricopeptide (TPR) repeat protein